MKQRLIDRRFARRAVAVAVFTAAALAIFAWLYGLTGASKPFSDPYRVRVLVPSAVQLTPGADVREAGLVVGTVRDLDHRGSVGVVDIELDTAHAPIRRDARVRVRTKTLVGENYLELLPGTSRAAVVPKDGVLPLRQAVESPQVDDFLSTLDAEGRRHLRGVLAGLAAGLEGRGDDLNALLRGLSDLNVAGHPLAATLRGQRLELARVVDNTGRVMHALSDRADKVRLFARQSRRAAQAAASRDRFIAQTIDQLPSTLRQARVTTSDLGRFSARSLPMFHDLRLATADLAPAFRTLGPAAAQARLTIAQLRPFIRRSNPLLERLRTFAVEADPAVPQIGELLRQLNPLVAYLAPRSAELGARFSNLASLTNSYDATGHLARLRLFVGQATNQPVGQQQRRATEALFKSGVLTRVSEDGLNPHPAPGTIGRPKPFSGAYQRLTALPPAGDP